MFISRVLAAFAISFALVLAAPIKQESYEPSVRIGVMTTLDKRAEEPTPSSSAMPSVRIGVMTTLDKRTEEHAPSFSPMPSLRYGVVTTLSPPAKVDKKPTVSSASSMPSIHFGVVPTPIDHVA